MCPIPRRPIWVLPLLLAFPCQPSRATDGAVAYRGAIIETLGPSGRLDSGTLVVRSGKIDAVGTSDSISIPDDARVVDLSGLTVLPGIVDPFFDLAAQRGADEGARTIVIGGRTIRVPSGGPTRTPSFTRMVEVFDPYANDFTPFLRSGFTHLNLVSRGGYGQAAVLRIQPDQRELQITEPAGILFLSVSNSPASLDILRLGIRSARRGNSGSSSGAASGSDPSRGRPTSGGPPRPPGDGDGPRPSTSPSGSSGSGDPQSSPNSVLPLWQAVVSGKSPLVIEAANAASILYTIDALKDEKDVKLVLIAAGGDVFQTLDALKARKATIVLRPEIDVIPNSTNRLNVARRVADEGLDLAFLPSADRSLLRETQDAPLFPLYMLVRTGLPRAVALEAVTKVPARIIGQEKNLGTLEPGKSGSFLVFEGDPLHPLSRLRQVVIEGRTVYEN